MFLPFKQYSEQDTETYIITNSATLNIGDPVNFPGAAASGGYVSPLTSTSAAVYGVVVGFVASPNGVSQGTLSANQVVATANNQTSAMVRARVLPGKAIASIRRGSRPHARHDERFGRPRFLLDEPVEPEPASRSELRRRNVHGGAVLLGRFGLRVVEQRSYGTLPSDRPSGPRFLLEQQNLLKV